jgi:hypothetical protein
MLTVCRLVDGHAAALILRLTELTKVELMPSELLWWGQEILKCDQWKRVTKGEDTMGWSGRPTLQSTMAVADEATTPDVKGKARAE